MLFMSCVCYAFASVQCCLVVTCWERADLLALVRDVYCEFVILTIGILGQVWYLIISFPDLCPVSYFVLERYIVLGKKANCEFITFPLVSWVRCGT